MAPADTPDGLGPGRPTTPTGRLIFSALSRLRLIPARDGRPATIPRPGPLQAGSWTCPGDKEHDMTQSSAGPIPATVPARLADATTVTAHPAVADMPVEIEV